MRDDLRRIARGEPSSAPAPVTPGSSHHDEAATAVPAADAGAAPSKDSEPTTRTTAAPVVPRGAAPAEDAPASPLIPRPSRRLPSGAVAAALALVLLLGLGTWLLWPDEESPDSSGSTAEPTTSDSQEPSAQPGDEPTEELTEEPTEEPTEQPDPSDGPATTRAAMRTFVEDYFAQVTSDPETTFAMLTPEFQSESGGFEGYEGFWSTIESATPRDIRADPRSLTTTYTIEFVTASGRTTTEQGRLQLARRGDSPLIAGEG